MNERVAVISPTQGLARQQAIDREKFNAEDDRPHPKVGAVIVKEGTIIGKAFRGQISEGDHADYGPRENAARSDLNSHRLRNEQY
jgi:pyrimidine deaminase RibD-like protein